MPTVPRLQRRHYVGVNSPLNSGFAFVQFSSKISVRRFCKRFSANCHLNRSHHPKSHRKRKSQLNVSAANTNLNNVQENTDDVRVNQADGLHGSSQEQPLNVVANKRVRRSTEVSISGMTDSGTESDFPKPKIDEKMAERQVSLKEKSKRRRRKRKSPLMNFSLTKYLSKLQVFPYSRYKELQHEYTQLKNANLKALKADLQEKELIHTESDLEKVDFVGSADTSLSKSRKRKRRPSRRQAHEAGTSDQSKRKKHRSRAKVSSLHYIFKLIF